MISKRSMSASFSPARSSTALIAGTGPMPMTSGGTPTAAHATRRASGVLPCFCSVVAAADQSRRRAIDDGRRIAAGLHAAEGRPDFRQAAPPVEARMWRVGRHF